MWEKFKRLFRSYRNESRINSLEKNLIGVYKDLHAKSERIGQLKMKNECLTDQINSLLIKIEDTAKTAQKRHDGYCISMTALEKAIDKMQDSNTMEGIIGRMARLEIMYIDVFKKAQETHGRSMRALVTQSARNTQYTEKLAMEQLKEFKEQIYLELNGKATN